MQVDDESKGIKNTENMKNMEDNEILEELKDAYKSVNALKESPSHRKILLDIERKIRKEQAQKK